MTNKHDIAGAVDPPQDWAEAAVQALRFIVAVDGSPAAVDRGRGGVQRTAPTETAVYASAS